MFKLRPALFALIFLIVLAGCKSEEEKAIDRMRPTAEKLTKAIEKQIKGRQASIPASSVLIAYDEHGVVEDRDKGILPHRDCLKKLAERGIIELRVTKEPTYPTGTMERYEPSVKEAYKKYLGKVDSSEVLFVGPYKLAGVGESFEKFINEWDETKDNVWLSIKGELTDRAPWYTEEIEAVCPYWVAGPHLRYTKANGWQ
ncbi:MAG: hypothetical protein LUG19_01895 [Desulfovibrio sp.]|uniref:hypothetical protein n=1 Tax=Desulfovibrio sp. TaxID=885 RepID=UPI00258DBCB4|nr:hypothetical protein [Desulfovibrio sp.]MCD7982992.1 hypothetical protein [Desulfovibrio sp.]